MIHALRTRFIRIATLSVALVMLLLTLILNVANFISNDRDLTTMLCLIQENEGEIPEQHPPGKPGSQPRGPITVESPYATRYFVVRYNGDGEIALSNLSHIASVTEDDLSEYLSAPLKKGSGFGYCDGFKYYAVKTGENRYLAVFLDCYQELRSIKTVALWSLVADGVCIALVYILVTLFSRRAIDPGVRSVERQKQFITDASHELKTPITVIATCLKVLEMEVGPQKWIGKAQGQTERLTHLVNDLVILSRLDEETPPVTMEPFDFSQAVEETTDFFRDPALVSGHEIVSDITPGIVYCGDETALRQLVSILLDNAVKYASPEGDIRIRLKKEHHKLRLTASNPCTPIPEEERSRLFDRFYRPDQSRTTATGGFGVGLSLARSIVEIHKGTIQVKCPQEDQIEFIVSLKV